MYTLQALQFLMFLIPGFAAAAILKILIVREEKKELGIIIEALIFSMVIYAIYSFASGRSPIALDQVERAITYDKISFLWLGSLSIIVPVVVSIFFTQDWHMKLARKLGISRKTARSSVWYDVFCDIRKPIIENFANERRIYGWPLYYSDNPQSPFIFLFEPAWIVEEKFIKLDVRGILITPEQKIEPIEFLED